MSALENLTSQTPQIAQVDNGLLRFLTCGSVDDGKSTLIGRLLYDTRAILADTLSAIARTSEKRGQEAIDLSLLTDGLAAEREQGITIDVAYRYFSTGRRKYIIADAPGHEQYTRNMVTAASTADLAIILVDARKGVLTQTRRHAMIAHLLGIHHLVVAVNKMDLAGYDEAVFERIRSDFLAFAGPLGLVDPESGQSAGHDVRFIPISALNGDMVAERGDSLPWYQGPTLLDVLENAELAHNAPGAADRREFFRFPVQFVCRPQASANPELHDYRGFMGKIVSGGIAPGERVTVLPSGIETTVRTIEINGECLEYALADQSVTLLLDDEIDISRGDMIVKSSEQPAVSRDLGAMLCWLGSHPLDPARTYTLRHGTREVKARLAAIDWRLDVNFGERKTGEQRLAMNDIARVNFRLAQPVFADAYADNRSNGAFIIIDDSTNNTVGAGMVNS